MDFEGVPGVTSDKARVRDSGVVPIDNGDSDFFVAVVFDAVDVVVPDDVDVAVVVAVVAIGENIDVDVVDGAVVIGDNVVVVVAVVAICDNANAVVVAVVVVGDKANVVVAVAVVDIRDDADVAVVVVAAVASVENAAVVVITDVADDGIADVATSDFDSLCDEGVHSAYDEALPQGISSSPRRLRPKMLDDILRL